MDRHLCVKHCYEITPNTIVLLLDPTYYGGEKVHMRNITKVEEYSFKILRVLSICGDITSAYLGTPANKGQAQVRSIAFPCPQQKAEGHQSKRFFD